MLAGGTWTKLKTQSTHPKIIVILGSSCHTDVCSIKLLMSLLLISIWCYKKRGVTTWLTANDRVRKVYGREVDTAAPPPSTTWISPSGLENYTKLIMPLKCKIAVTFCICAALSGRKKRQEQVYFHTLKCLHMSTFIVVAVRWNSKVNSWHFNDDRLSCRPAGPTATIYATGMFGCPTCRS